MKIILAGLAAFAMAGPLMAQTVTPVEPSPPPTENTAPAADTMAPAAPMATEPKLTERDGKWWNGDREATKAEIAEYKKAHKMAKPK